MNFSSPAAWQAIRPATRCSRQSELQRRVRLTARFLCRELGENDDSTTSPVPSCRDGAYRNAMNSVGKIEQGFAPCGTTWVAGPAWAPPYPADGVSRYP